MSSDTSAALGALGCALGMLSATAVAMDALGRIFGTGCPQLDLRHWVLSAVIDDCVSPLCIVRVWPVASSGAQ